MGCFAGAEIWDVESFTSNKLSNVFKNKNIRLYGDDVLGAMKKILYSKRKHTVSFRRIQDGGERPPYQFFPFNFYELNN